MSDHQPIDLSALAPSADDLARGIASRCAPLLEARRDARALVQIASWCTPLVAAAIVIAIVSSLVLTRAPLRRNGPEMASRGSPGVDLRPAATQLAAALGMPRAIAIRITRPVPPTIVEMLNGAPR